MELSRETEEGTDHPNCNAIHLPQSFQGRMTQEEKLTDHWVAGCCGPASQKKPEEEE